MPNDKLSGAPLQVESLESVMKTVAAFNVKNLNLWKNTTGTPEHYVRYDMHMVDEDEVGISVACLRALVNARIIRDVRFTGYNITMDARPWQST